MLQGNRCILLHVGDNVAVDVERDRDGGVPEHLTHYLWVHLACKEQGRRCVAKVVKANVWQSAMPEQLLEPTVDIARRKGTTSLRTEYQFMIFPSRSKIYKNKARKPLLASGG
jgi:hypothetical protein